MKRLPVCLTPALLALTLSAAPLPNVTRGDAMLADYLRNETAALSEHCLADIRTCDDWKSQRAEYRRQLAEMLGLWPMPERTDLQPVITGKLEADEFTVEKLQFQASPHLYVTANFYLPKKIEKPLPAILLECGHARVLTNGISYGNKAAYQNLGAWFARNGYACLVLDTLLLGEIQGLHVGTRDLGQWWWNSRGYTPAGVEAWFGIRALDYLCTRPEVDTNRFGITGHSGGGAYSWTVGALDDRIKAAAPMAGLTDLQNQVLDGVLDSHCDCNFFINTYRWDFPQMAALLAPRPLLIGTTDRDRLFPVSGVSRLYSQVRRIYELCGETNKLGFVIAPGPHEFAAEQQVATLRWFNRYLKGDEPPVDTTPKPFFTPQQLKVFTTLPADAINTNIQASFVPPAKTLTAAEAKQQRDSLLAQLKEKSFGGWPAEDIPLDAKQMVSAESSGLKFSAWDFTSQHDVRLRLYFIERAGAKPAGRVPLHVLDDAGWQRWLAAMRAGFGTQLVEELAGAEKPAADSAALGELRRELDSGAVLAFFAPRGVGMTAFSGDEKVRTRIRRRFMLLGQTLDGMRVWDIRRAVQMVHFVREADVAKVELRASGTMGVNALYAALFEPGVRRLEFAQLPKSQMEGPDYLNVLRVTDIPQVLAIVSERAEVKMD